MTKHYLVPRTRGRLWYMTCGSISPKYSLPSTCLSLQICGFFGIYSQSFFASKPFVSDLCIRWQQDAFLCILGDSRWKGKEDWGIDGSQLASLQPSNRLSEISPYLPASIVFLTLSFPFFICIPFFVWCLNSPVLFASLQSIKLRKGEKKGRVKRKNGTQSAVGLKDLREEKGEKTRETFLFISVPLLLSHLSALPHSPIRVSFPVAPWSLNSHHISHIFSTSSSFSPFISPNELSASTVRSSVPSSSLPSSLRCFHANSQS